MTAKRDWPIDQMRQWYEEGKSTNDIGRLLHCRFQVVAKVLKRAGVQMRKRGCCSKGSLNPAWKGGRQVDKHGYILIWMPDHPYASRHGYVREHRLVMEARIGRYLLPSEVVHHRNDDPGDNRYKNLQLYSSNAEHLRDTITGQVPQWTPAGRAAILAAIRKPRGGKANRSQSKDGDGPCIQTTAR